MKLLKLTLHNCISYEDEVIDFSNMKLLSIIGDNGSGKSSLLETINFILFGKTKFETDDELIKDNEDDLKGELLFRIDNKEFTVIRTKRRGKSAKLELYNGSNRISGTTIAETEEKINQILNATYDTFINSVFIEQDKFDQPIQLKSAEKYQMLMSFLDIEKYTRLKILAEKKVDGLVTEITFLESKITSLKADIINVAENFEQQTAEIQKRIEAFKKEINKMEQEINETLTEISKLKVVQDNYLQAMQMRKLVEEETRSLNSEFDKKSSCLKTCTLETAATIYKKYLAVDVKDKTSILAKQLI